MHEVIQPSKFIRIGFREGRVVLVDWTDFSGEFVNEDSEDVIQKIVRYLREAEEFITKDV